MKAGQRPHDRLAAAFAEMADGLLIVDVRSGDVEVNHAARQMLALPSDIAITTAYLQQVVGFYPFDLVSATSGAFREEVRIGSRVLHSVVTPLVEAGQMVGAVVALRDLGEASEIAHRRAEYAQLMSHELRSPLTSVGGALDLVLTGYAGEVSPKQRRYIEMARDATSKMNLLVDQLLDLARVQAGTIQLVLSPLRLEALTHDVIERFAETSRVKGVRFDVVSSAVDLPILGDADRLAQVLSNLFSNAIKFAPAGGVVGIELFGPPSIADAVGVSVHNAGEPLAEEERERIFEPFSASGRKVGGTGLGLNISRSIIEAHGGRMWAETGERGTRFVFTLPVRPAEDNAAPLAIDPATEVSRPTRRDRARVLVCDTDRHRALMLKGLLMATDDEVVVVDDMDAAVSTAHRIEPHLIIVTSGMHDAAALIAYFEHDPNLRNTAVIAVADAAMRDHLLRAGADDIVDLPVVPTIFHKACQRALDTSRREASRVLFVDDDSTIRAICRELLDQNGYVTRTLGNAALVLDETHRFRPDVIVLDLMMPGADGLGLIETLRRDPVAALTPLIVLSARGDTADKVRAFRAGAEDYLVKPFDAAELVARVGKAMERQTRELGASPTTQLPGADAIETAVNEALRDPAQVICYLDLDHLKALNDFYGYAKADAVIRQMGSVMREVIATRGGPTDFIGHIAGDDFVLITTVDRVDAICRAITDRFDRIVPLYYDPADRARGYIETKDRYGTMRRFPIMSVSIAAVSSSSVSSYAELGEIAAVGKKTAKGIAGSSYVRDGVPVPR